MAELFSRHETDEDELLRRGLVPAPPVAPRAATPASTRPNYPRTDPRHAPPGFRSPYEGADPLGVAGDAAKKVLGGASEHFRDTNTAVTRAKENVGSAAAGFRQAKSPADYGRATRDTIGTGIVGAVDVLGNYAKDAAAPILDPLMKAGQSRADYAGSVRDFASGFLGLDSPRLPTAEAADSPLEVTVTDGQRDTGFRPWAPPRESAEPGLEDVAMGGPEAHKPTSALAPPPTQEPIEIIRGTERSYVDPVHGRGVDAPAGRNDVETLIARGYSMREATDKSLEMMKAQAQMINANANDRSSKMSPVLMDTRVDPRTGMNTRVLHYRDENGALQTGVTGNVLPVGDSFVVQALDESDTSATGEKTERQRMIVMRPQLQADGTWTMINVPLSEANADERLAAERGEELQALIQEFARQNPGRQDSDYQEAAMQWLRENPAEEE